MSTDTLRIHGWPGEQIRRAVVEWLNRYGIDENRVPIPCVLTRHLLPEPPGITYRTYAVDEAGRFTVANDQAVIEDIWLPLEQDPEPFPSLDEEGRG